MSGTFTYTVTVTDSAGNTGTVNCSVTVAPAGERELRGHQRPSGRGDHAGDDDGRRRSGWTRYTFTATGLPPGLSISSTGTI